MKSHATFDGIVTLANPEEARELVQLIDTIVHKSVDVFKKMERDYGAVDDLLKVSVNNLHL